MKNLSLIVSGLIATTAFAVVSCTQPSKNPDNHENDSPPTPLNKIESPISEAQSLNPEAAPPKLGNLVLAGTLVPVDVKATREGNTLLIECLSRDTVVEREKYSFSDKVFAIVSGPSDVFEPPIAIIQYPMDIGSESSWAGKVRTGTNSNPAKAIIKSSQEPVNEDFGSFQALKVTVDLRIDTGSPEQSEARLQFWFKPGEGMIMREFGAVSKREPRISEDREPTSPEEG
ncbi:MAG: hypothetical protein KDC26_01545 [Armatimonadetes bacterium]|nr:hypothetical protein [Armatimonadota bacterium]